MTHQKRLSAPKHYPIERKDAAYVITGTGPHKEDDSIPVAVLLRDVLEYADNLSEARQILSARNISINGKIETDPQRTIGFMDVIEIDKLDTALRVSVDKDGLVFNEISDSDRRLRRIKDKTTVTGGQTQLNLDGGENILVDENYGAKGSLVFENSEITGFHAFEEGSLAYITGGQHIGEIGEIVDINVVKGSQPNRVTVEGDNGEFETIEDYIYVIGDEEPEVEV